MKKNNKKGFTLVELVIVVAVMAVLVAVAIPTVGAITERAKAAVNDSNARTIESIIKLAEAEANNTTNTNAGATGTTSNTVALTGAQIDTAITNAKLGIDGTFVYEPSTGKVTVGSTGTYVITCNSSATETDDTVTVTPTT